MAQAQAAVTTVPSDDVAIQLIGVHKWYGQFHVLKDINLSVFRGERTADRIVKAQELLRLAK